MSFALHLGNRVLAFVSVVVLARLLGAEGYGIFAYALAIVTACRVFSDYGIPTYALRESSVSASQNAWPDFWRNLNSGFSAVTLLGIAVAMLAIFIAAAVGSEHLYGWAFAFMSIPFGAIGLLAAHGLRGAQFNFLGQGSELLLRPAFGLLIIALPMLMMPSWRQVEYALAGQLIVSVLVAMFAWTMLRKKVPPIPTQENFKALKALPWRSSLTPLTTSAGAMLLISQADLLLLGFWGSSRDLGVYRVAMQVAVLLGFALHVANTAFSPRFAALAANAERDQLKSLLVKINGAIAAVTIPGALLLIAFGDVILLWLFGPAYVEAYIPLCILIIGHAVNNLTGPTGVLLNMSGHEATNRNILLGCAALVIALASLLIPTYGLIGAASAAAICLVLRAILQFVAVYRLVIAP